MARGRRGTDQGTQLGPREIEPPYPSSPSRPPRFCFYLRRGDRQQAHPVYATYAAKKIFDHLTRNQSFKWAQPDEVITDGGTHIRLVGMAGRAALETVVEYEPTPKEAEWELGDSERNRLDSMLVDFVERAAPEQTERPPVAGRTKRDPKPERAPRPVRDGLVSVGTIAQELGLNPREARGILRSLKLSKPDAGWAWPAAEAASVKARIAAEMVA